MTAACSRSASSRVGPFTLWGARLRWRGRAVGRVGQQGRTWKERSRPDHQCCRSARSQQRAAEREAVALDFPTGPRRCGPGANGCGAITTWTDRRARNGGVLEQEPARVGHGLPATRRASRSDRDENLVAARAAVSPPERPGAGTSMATVTTVALERLELRRLADPGDDQRDERGSHRQASSCAARCDEPDARRPLVGRTALRVEPATSTV
jgi:hypothetical protein